MGFLDGLCDYADDEAVVTWSSFWRLQSLCSLTTLGAAASFLAAVGTLFAVLAQWSTSSTTRNGTKREYQHLNGSTNDNGDGGREEAKGGDGQSFAASASAPLLNEEDRSDDGFEYGDDDDDDDEGQREESYRGGRKRRSRQSKKGTGVHWLKLLLYWTQAAYHLGVGAFDLVDGHADDPYKCKFLVRTSRSY